MQLIANIVSYILQQKFDLNLFENFFNQNTAYLKGALIFSCETIIIR